MSKLLEFISYHDLTNWSVNQYLDSSFFSKYNIVLLKKYIKEEKEKIKPFEFPDKKFGILGVNNKIGLFDNEIKKGKEINQAYKKVKNGFLAYNPYRINVGSIGLKTDLQNFDLISPAYVIFSCKKELLPEYLYLIFKTQTFNNIIQKSTRGSVRQILAFDILENLKIPLPPLEKQKEIVEAYQSKIALAEKQEQEAKEKEKEIEEYLYRELGIEAQKIKENNNILNFINFKTIDKWTVKDLLNTNAVSSNLFQTVTLSKIILDKPKYGSNSRGIKKITDTRYIRITDINEDGTLNNEVVSPEEISENYILKQDDFLIARSGNTVGKTFLYDEKYGRCLYAGYLIKFVLNQDLVNPYYLLYYTKSQLYKKWINSNLRVAGQPNINSKEYLQSPIILPDMKIQNKIVAYIKNLKTNIENLKKQSQQNKTIALQEFEKEIFNEA